MKALQLVVRRRTAAIHHLSGAASMSASGALRPSGAAVTAARNRTF
jgi:hypothetical protein